MSKIKEQLKDYLKNIGFRKGFALSIGNANDDRKYFSEADFVSWETMDIDRELTPNILHDMNKPLMDDNEIRLDEALYEKYDYVFAFELWEYIYDPVTAHRNLHYLLKPGGTYMGSYVFVYPKHNPPGMDYLRYTDDGIRKLLETQGFRDIKITPRTGNELLLDFYDADGMRSRKDIDNTITGWIVEAKK